MDRGSFIVHVKTEDIDQGIVKDIEKWFCSSNFELDKPLAKQKNKNAIGLIKDELGEQLWRNLLDWKQKK